MTVHDAYYGSPKQVLLAKAKYDTDSVDLANKYDYVTTAINEVKDALVKMEDGPLKQTIKVKLAELKLENDTLVKAKKEYTKDLEVNVLGNIPTELKIEAEPETETKEDIVPGYIGVVFNTFGKVYDYEVDNIYDYNVGDTKKTFGTTFTIKNKLEAKDYKLKEGIEYKNINLITKEDIDEIQAIDKTLDTVLLKEAVNEVAEGNGVVKLIELVQSLNVSKLLEPIKDKVINGLRNGQIEDRKSVV